MKSKVLDKGKKKVIVSTSIITKVAKDKMKTHLLCMGLGYWLITKVAKDIVEEDNLERNTEEQREVFMCNIRAREAILSTLLESEYNQVKLLKTSHEIWKALEANY